MLLGKDGTAGCDAAHYREARGLYEPQPARRAGSHLDRAFARQGFEMLFRGVRGTKAHAAANLGTSGRKPPGGKVFPDQLEDLSLARCQFVHSFSMPRLGGANFGLGSVTVIIYSIASVASAAQPASKVLWHRKRPGGTRNGKAIN